MDDQNALRERIRDVYPELVIKAVRLNSQGWSNAVLVVNEHLIFRFPRSELAVAEMTVEIAILQRIQDNLSLAVPNPIYYSLSPRSVGQVFMGYSMLPGEPLWRNTFAAINEEVTLDRLAQQLGAFLRELHGLPQAITIDLPLVGRRREDWMSLYVRMQGTLFPLMAPNAHRYAAWHFELFLSDPANFNYDPCLSHRDFATSNILVDGVPHHISGIIDFGRAGRADPAIDFASILYGYGESFLRRFLLVYPQIEAALPRAHFYNENFALETALSAVENSDEALLKRSLEWYDALRYGLHR